MLANSLVPMAKPPSDKASRIRVRSRGESRAAKGMEEELMQAAASNGEAPHCTAATQH